MKIKKLIIKSFRGLENAEFELNDGLNVFAGDNRLGKSTIIDSAMWCLCDETLVNGKQDSDNRNMLDLKKPLNVILEMDNGVILERKYKDIWKEDEDGTLRYSRTDNQFLINGAKYKKEEYFEFIKDSIGLTKRIKSKDFNLLRAIIDYNYFSSIDYKIARKFTEELLDLKSDLDLLDEGFAPIKTDMQILKFECGKCINKYKNDFDRVDNMIAEKTSLINNLIQNVKEDEISKYNELIERRTNLINDNIQYNADYKALEQLLEQNRLNIQEEEKTLLIAKNELEKEINDLISKGNKNNYEISMQNSAIETVKSGTVGAKNRIEELRNSIKNIESKEFEVSLCPHCGKPLNQEQKESFEKIKKDKLDSLNAEILKMENIIKENDNNINFRITKIQELENNQKEMKKAYFEAKDKLDSVEKEIEDNTKVKELLVEQNNIKNKINDFINNYNNKKNEVLFELTSEIDKLSSMINDKNKCNDLKVEIQNLKKQKAYLEMQIELVKDFKELKRNMIKENTSKVFPNVELEIIEENENTGSTKDVCYAKLKGVEYKAINDGHRYLVGITIIEDIKRNLGLKDLPIIFDKFADIGKETLEEIKKITNAQIITTLVNDNKEITLNKENN